MQEVEISPSYFAGHRCVPHEESEWFGNHCVPYYTYLIFELQGPPDATAFANGGGIHAGFKSDALSVMKVGGSEEADVNV